MIFRQAKGNAMQAFDFTKAKTRVLTGENQKEKITFKRCCRFKRSQRRTPRNH